MVQQRQLIAAGVSYQAGVTVLPSVFLIIVGVLLMAIFAELEGETLIGIKYHSIELHDWHLVLLVWFGPLFFWRLAC